MPIKGMKSKDYLDFIGSQVCPITGRYPVDCHHESVTRRFSGSLKKHFDYGALPLEHEIHLSGRHNTGKTEFWESHSLDPAELVVEYLIEYIELEPSDVVEAQYALSMVRKDNGL